MNTLEQRTAQILGDDSFKLDIRNAGIFRFLSGYRFDKHNHREIEIIYIKSGHCIMDMEGKFVPLKVGDCIVLCPGVPHSFFVDQKSSCQIAQLEFRVTVPKFVEQKFMRFPPERFYEFSDCDMVKELIEGISRRYRRRNENKYGTVQIKLMFLQLFMELANKIEEDGKAAKDSRIDRIISYINENYEYDINVEELAEKFGISSRYLRKRFQLEAGISCSQYITSVRIEKAKGLLWHSTKTVTEIAGLTGFNSSQYFSRIFYQNTGQTPVEYRNTWKGEKAEERYMIELDKEEWT